MVGENNTALMQLGERIEVVLQEIHIPDVWRLVANGAQGLCEGRTAECLAALRQVDIEQDRLSHLFHPTKLRCPRASDVLHQ